MEPNAEAAPTLPDVETLPDPLGQTQTATAVEEPWEVVIFNDPVNTCGYVTFVLKRVLQIPAEQAEALMWIAHREGKAVVRRCGREEADRLVVELTSYALQAGVQR